MAKHDQPDAGWRQFVLNSLPKMESTAPAPTSLTPGPANPQPVNVGFSGLLPQRDAIDGLPPDAAEKMRLLGDRSRDAHAVIPPFEEIREASTAKVAAEQRLRQLQAPAGEGGFAMPADYPGVVAQQKVVDRLTDELRRINERAELTTASWHPKSAASRNVETYVLNGLPGGTVLADDEGEAPKLNKGEGILDGIERLRRRGRELKADLHRIRSAPFPSSYAKAQMRTQIERLAERGAPDVTNLIEHDGDVAWPTKRVKVNVLNAGPGAIGFVEIPDMLAIDAWRNKDATLAKLDAEINTEADDKAALSHEARGKAEAEVLGDLLAVERDESALVWLAQAQGLPVEHRTDCSPLAILGCRLITVPRATSTASSPSLAGYNIIGGR